MKISRKIYDTNSYSKSVRYETYKSIQFKRGLPAFGLQGTSKSPPNKFEQGTMNVCVLPPPSPGSFCIFGIQSVAIRCILWGNSVCYGCWSVFTFFIYLFFYFILFFIFIYLFFWGDDFQGSKVTELGRV